MPRTILVRPPGGATGRVRRWYAVHEKLKLLEECNRLRRLENLSLQGAAAVMSIPHTVLVRWTKARPRLIASLGRMKAICEGPVGQLDCIREELLQWIFARREQGIAVTMPHVVYKVLTPMMIYKGKATGHIATREFKHHDPSSLYACQDAAWMDEVCMLRWVDEILKLYLKVNPPPPASCHRARHPP